MDRRTLILSGLAATTTGLGGCATTGSSGYQEAGGEPSRTYSSEEIVRATSDFLGVTAEAAGAAIEKIFRENGRPTGYIAGEEGAGAVTVGARYGRGLLYMKERETLEVFWQGPTIGFDVGGNASRVFTLCYDLHYPDMIFRRFPGVEGSAYVIGGLGVQYQRADGITLAPIRAGVGLRLGANVGY
ncbi:MAG TPA: EipA family protein, partial [Caulobacter sp.]|nr:EipA family protein [Caulobacter sp.]